MVDNQEKSNYVNLPSKNCLTTLALGTRHNIIGLIDIIKPLSSAANKYQLHQEKNSLGLLRIKPGAAG